MLETQKFEFGEFLLDTKQKVLLRNGNPVSITPKVYEMLFVLLERRGQIIEKADLIRDVWKDCFVEESSLTFTIGQLRKALGDDARDPTFIETVPRRGYRFIAEVSEIKVNPELIRQRDSEIENRLKNRYFETKQTALFPLSKIFASSKYLFWSVFLIILACGIYIFDRSFQTQSPAPVKQLEIEKIISTEKVEFVSISPDGKLLAYTDESNGKNSLWIRNLVTSENTQILPPTDEYYFGLAFTNTGDSIYFVKREKTGTDVASLYRVSIFGGIPEKIIGHTEGWISLSPDDRSLSFVRCEYLDSDFCSLYIADSDGKNERKLVTKPKPIRIADNQFSPDGTSIAFAAGQSWNGGSDFRLMSFDIRTASENELLPHKFFVIKNLRWLPDGKNLLMTAKENFTEVAKIWQVSTETGNVTQITNDAEDYQRLSLDNSGTRLIATQLIDNFRLSLSSLENPSARKNLSGARFAVFTPAGKIIYTSKKKNIWTISQDGSGQKQLTKNSAADYSPRVSPDSRYIFFTSNRSGTNQIWRMDADGGNKIQLTKQQGGFPRFTSPDGKWIFFESDLYQTLWKVAADGSGRETKLSENKIISPASSPDGKFIAYILREKKESQAKIAVMNLENKNIFKVVAFPDGKTEPLKTVWSKDNQSIFYITQNESGKELWRHALEKEKPHFLANLSDEKIMDFDISPDEKNFIFVRGNWLQDVVLINDLQKQIAIKREN